MKPHSLFTVVLKVLAIILIRDFVLFLPQFLYYIPMIMEQGELERFTLWNIATSLVSVLFYYVVIYVLLFETDFVIKKLKLDQKFTEETINLNLHRSVVIHIATMVTGGLLVISSLPYLIDNVREYFIQTRNDSGISGIADALLSSPSIKHLIINVMQLLIGFWLFTNPRFVAAYIDRTLRKAKYNKKATTDEQNLADKKD